jgi:hypothetical protein
METLDPDPHPGRQKKIKDAFQELKSLNGVSGRKDN